MANLKKRSPALSQRVFRALLVIYPQEFRREYGREMALVFHDRCRAEGRKGAAALARLWCESLLDLAVTAPGEHADRLSGGGFMRVLRTIVLALAAYAFALLVVVPLYMRNRETLPLPWFVGNMIDALIATGIVFNIIFLVITLPRFAAGVRAVRLAGLLTALIIGGLILFIAMTGGPPASLNLSIIVAQVSSFFIWYFAHLWWVLRRRDASAPPEPA